jgi:hypothetical protein
VAAREIETTEKIADALLEIVNDLSQWGQIRAPLQQGQIECIIQPLINSATLSDFRYGQNHRQELLCCAR